MSERARVKARESERERERAREKEKKRETRKRERERDVVTRLDDYPKPKNAGGGPGPRPRSVGCEDHRGLERRQDSTCGHGELQTLTDSSVLVCCLRNNFGFTLLDEKFRRQLAADPAIYTDPPPPAGPLAPVTPAAPRASSATTGWMAISRPVNLSDPYLTEWAKVCSNFDIICTIYHDFPPARFLNTRAWTLQDT